MLYLSAIRPLSAFAAFVFWLLAIPMNGPATAGIAIETPLNWFLLPHVTSLILIGKFCPPARFQRFAPWFVAMTMLMSLTLPIFPEAAAALLIVIGIGGAFVALSACCHVKSSSKPLLSSAVALVIANAALVVFHQLSMPPLAGFFAATAPLLLLFSTAQEWPQDQVQTYKLRYYLPFILIFHVVSGLMYGVLYPAYQELSISGGVELPFYMAAVIGAALLTRINREIPLILGVVLGTTAFILLHWPHPYAIPLSMFTMQAGQGFIDLFLLAFLLRFPDPLRAFGFGLATLCLGIYSGQILGDILNFGVVPITLSGHLFLNLSVLTLYLANRRHRQLVSANVVLADPPAADLEQRPAPQDENDLLPTRIPEHLRLLLSEREFMVLLQSLKGTTYKDIAEGLEISESSVKTYMKRIFDKFEVSGRKGLYQLLSSGDPK